METVLGIKGKDFVMLASDTMLAKSIFFLKDNNTKIRPISSNSMMAVVGNNGDTLHFADFIATNISLYEIRNGYDMDTPTVVHFTRNHILDNIRNKVSSRVAMLLAGYDSEFGPNLCFIDAQGTTMPLNYSGHGLGHPICTSIFHMMWKPDLTFQEGCDIVRRCVVEIQNRLVINLRNFDVFVVDKDGVRELPPFCAMPIGAPMPLLTPLPISNEHVPKPVLKQEKKEDS
ncbi:probable proteasome subunit beta type-2 [Drosophila montana]|uniref:probable proteasome subunit beta type-2 n=1 Tax=Drosophila montana TaxID=40370 RepID=UPI00313BDDBB